ncbi:MAG: serine/threonine-protein kinase [Verrucomicrobiota bacterium]
MATETRCPHCGKPVPVTALGGICPECLIKAGAADTGESGPDGTVVIKPPQPAPAIAEIAPYFPQLEIIRCLGRGGMGAVYQARQPGLDRFVALKILSRKRDSGVPDTEFAERFQREARALARLSHPSIVAVYDFGAAGGFHFLLMEFVDGLTLRQLLQTKKLSPEEALSIVPKICEALQFAHEQGIVHRDIKPENILLDKQGRVKIADFGIAKILGDETPARNLTGAKEVIGTPHYMAPEQVEQPATVDHRADIYSLGVVFYEMLTGELPLGKFSVPSQKVQVDVRLDEVVLHALEKEPARRYQHASEVKTDVETIAATERPPVVAATPLSRSPKARLAQLALVLFLVGTLGTLALMVISPRHDMALIFGGVALVMALVFGGLSWKTSLGRGIALATLALFAVLTITVGVFTGWQAFQANTVRAELRARQAEMESYALAARKAALESEVIEATKIPVPS